jgi:hypothetical protein
MMRPMISADTRATASPSIVRDAADPAGLPPAPLPAGQPVLPKNH